MVNASGFHQAHTTKEDRVIFVRYLSLQLVYKKKDYLVTNKSHEPKVSLTQILGFDMPNLDFY